MFDHLRHLSTRLVNLGVAANTTETKDVVMSDTQSTSDVDSMGDADEDLKQQDIVRNWRQKSDFPHLKEVTFEQYQEMAYDNPTRQSLTSTDIFILRLDFLQRQNISKDQLAKMLG